MKLHSPGKNPPVKRSLCRKSPVIRPTTRKTSAQTETRATSVNTRENFRTLSASRKHRRPRSPSTKECSRICAKLLPAAGSAEKSPRRRSRPSTSRRRRLTVRLFPPSSSRLSVARTRLMGTTLGMATRLLTTASCPHADTATTRAPTGLATILMATVPK